MTGTVTGECDRECNYVVNVIGTVTVHGECDRDCNCAR